MVVSVCISVTMMLNIFHVFNGHLSLSLVNYLFKFFAHCVVVITLLLLLYRLAIKPWSDKHVEIIFPVFGFPFNSS